MHKKLFRVLTDSAQLAALALLPDDLKLHGTVISGSVKTHCKVRFDLLPSGNLVVEKVRCVIMSIVFLGKEEPEHYHADFEQPVIEDAGIRKESTTKM